MQELWQDVKITGQKKCVCIINIEWIRGNMHNIEITLPFIFFFIDLDYIILS